MFLISPTEPAEIKAIGTTSSIPELYGVDVFFIANGRKIGIQRKEYKDLIASCNDGRLALEVQQMSALDYKLLYIEGVLRWTTENTLILPSQFTSDTWSRDRWDGLMWSMKDRNIWIEYTDSVTSTITLIRKAESWFSKTRHSSLLTRPNSGTSMWGTGVQHKPFAAWMMQGIPGIGYTLAERIIDTIGFPLMLKPEMTVEKLSQVEGIGKGKAQKIVDVMSEGEE